MAARILIDVAEVLWGAWVRTCGAVERRRSRRAARRARRGGRS